MKKVQAAKTKSDKPFLAARIPHGLETALESHVKSTGESKTLSVVKALGAYLNWTEDKSNPNASDRLSLLEKKVTELENFLKTPHQTNWLDEESVIKNDAFSDNEKEKRQEKPSKNSVIKKDKNNDNNPKVPEPELSDEENSGLMTHKELAELTKLNYHLIRKKPQSKNPKIEWEERTFKVIQIGKKWYWEEIAKN
jgi:hypothetical protein